MTKRAVFTTIVILAAIAALLLKFGPFYERREREGIIEGKPDIAYKPAVAIVLDDFGYTEKNLKDLKRINAPVTIAVLPNTPYSEKVSSFAGDNGMEVILHLPMEPMDQREALEEDTIRADMSEREVKHIIDNSLRSVPGAVGVSNHMGSKATKDKKIMGIVLDDIYGRGMFFLDSRTSKGSVCGYIAEKKGMQIAERDIFIDNVMDKKEIAERLKDLEKEAVSKGFCVAIGHDRSLTIEVLKRIVPEMQEKGIKFVKLSELVKGRGR